MQCIATSDTPKKMYIRNDICVICGLSFIQTEITPEVLLLLLSINASLFPEYCRIENYIHVVRSATFHLQLKNFSEMYN